MKINQIAHAINVALLATSITTAVHADEEKELEVIVVQGQKIDRTLQDTPTSVAVLTSKEMQNNNITNMSDVMSMMPNVAGDFNKGFSIRGIDAFSVSGSGNSFLTSVYLDGAPLPFRMIKSGGLSVWDLSQVEVFRGPQSTLQGRNALAGAIVLRSEDPTYETTGKAQFTLGDHGQYGYAFAGGTSIIDDMLAFRVSYEDKSLDGDIYNTTRDDFSNFEDSETLRAKVLFEPNQDVDVLFTYTQNVNKYGPNWSLYNYGESLYDRTVDFNTHIWEQTDTDIYTLEVTWDINDSFALHSISTYNESEYRYNWDGDMSSEQIVRDTQNRRVDETFSQELRLTYDTDTLQAVIGVYTSKVDVADKADGERYFRLYDAIGVSDFTTAVAGFLMQAQGLPAQVAMQTAAMVAPLYPDIDPLKLEMDYGLTQEVKTSAIYGDLTWSATDKIDILAGLRYDTEEQSNSSNNEYRINNSMPDPTSLPAPINAVVAGLNQYLNGFAAAATGVEPVSSTDLNAWLPKLGASYHIDADTTTSFIYQRGYRSGGVGFNIAQSRIYTYEPEYTNNYEFSYRSVLLDGKLVFNTNAFLLKWEDQQVARNYGSTFNVETVNAGESKVKGFETEIFYYPSEKLSIKGGIGLAKTEFTHFISNGVDLKGRAFEDSPEWTANIASNYRFDNGLYLNVNAKYTDSSSAYLDPENDMSAVKYAANNNPRNDARVIVNAQMGYHWDKYSVRLDVSNLLDEEYIVTYFNDADDRQNTFGSYGQSQIGRSRQISATFQMDF
ncbi:hypothetical protein CWB96_03070 [Pseudoalteromonas citrea]|uniref:TonB-dependent receptor n=1 Tax=Pseudoalteromonas citrea TaxID=43655 RepID=A0A5S3XVH2_9GAMM|nr:TonB-dependent receptor [Pseudoalteromonas citrea]TMP40490.1 hypothetical protein CWB97_18070 [Pseudoalteromonas citrea]TMP61782.1 hypothetical protein CWB96_03070 [Pseudoalteromonas citrea]